MNGTNPDVDDFIAHSSTWQAELRVARSIVLGCGLVEEFKWRQPCYTFRGKNVVILSGFKDHFGLGFFKGSLLDDPDEHLVVPGPNSRSSRLLRFSAANEISEAKPMIVSFIKAAVEVERAGREVASTPITDYDVPEELRTKMVNDPAFKEAFDTLTPGRQKGYLLYFSQAKQTATRSARIERFTPRILAGYGKTTVFVACQSGNRTATAPIKTHDYPGPSANLPASG